MEITMFMRKLTISIAIFYSYVKLPAGIVLNSFMIFLLKPSFKRDFVMTRRQLATCIYGLKNPGGQILGVQVHPPLDTT